jgi:radical SAM-linked protein
MLRTFQKMFSRAGIPVAYSEGFNPHQIFAFASALAVGVTSEGEYMDIKLTEEISVDQLIQMMNTSAPVGIQFTDGIEIASKEISAMASVVAATYLIHPYTSVITNAMIEDMMSQETLIIKKKNKKGKVNDFDLRPGILNLSLKEDDILMTVATGSTFNVKPELVLEKLLTFGDVNYDRGNYLFHRVELYQEHNGLRSLLDTKLGL